LTLKASPKHKKEKEIFQISTVTTKSWHENLENKSKRNRRRKKKKWAKKKRMKYINA